MTSPRVIAIAAMDSARVIGKDGTLPWRLPEDMKHFAALTTGHAVLMGRKTYESIPQKYRPLSNRLNVVISRNAEFDPQAPGVLVFTSPEAFFDACGHGDVKLPSDTVWIAGGAEIYRATLPRWDEVQLTLVAGSHEGDAFFPPFEEQFKEVQRAERESAAYIHYLRRMPDV